MKIYNRRSGEQIEAADAETILARGAAGRAIRRPTARVPRSARYPSGPGPTAFQGTLELSYQGTLELSGRPRVLAWGCAHKILLRGARAGGSKTSDRTSDIRRFRRSA